MKDRDLLKSVLEVALENNGIVENFHANNNDGSAEGKYLAKKHINDRVLILEAIKRLNFKLNYDETLE